jgi:ArsR family transcriptional regulator, arsenate/arsenite/antimonite-responsive transcriptional repressor
VGEIAACCAVDLSVVSRHLKLLAGAGVLEATREGRTVRYSLRANALAERLHALADAFTAGCCEKGCCSGCCCGCS